MKRHRVVRLPTGEYVIAGTANGVTRYVGPGMSEVQTIDKADHFDNAADANARIDELTGNISAGMPIERFNMLTSHVPMRDGTRDALRAILVGGSTWAKAAQTNGLTQSGIKRALDRVKKANPGA